MPVMLRPKGLPEKIAFSILGVPANLRGGKSSKESKVDRAIAYQNTQRIK